MKRIVFVDINFCCWLGFVFKDCLFNKKKKKYKNKVESLSKSGFIDFQENNFMLLLNRFVWACFPFLYCI